MALSEPRARIGTSAWKKPRWRGDFYPAGLAQRDELRFTAERLSTLEINTTFHGRPSLANFLAWRDETPEGFVFAVKGSKFITHVNPLQDAQRTVAAFFRAGVLGLQEKLGPLLWQLPETLEFDPGTVEAFLAALPHSLEGRSIRHAVEARHDSFLDPAFLELLHRYDVAAVVTNTPGQLVIDEVTSGFVYLRLYGDAQHHGDGYDDASLSDWATRIRGWVTGTGCPDGRGRDVFCYFHNPDQLGTRTPFDAMRLQERIDRSPAR
jgi:uncharacterized protein YecE (DUF72 family)